MTTIVVLLNRVLRLHDHPALATAVRRADHVVPLFVVDPDIVRGDYGAPNRLSFLHDALGDLRGQLRELGGDLVLRSGAPHEQAIRLAKECDAEAIFFSEDVTGWATARQRRLAEAGEAAGVEVAGHPGVGIVEPGVLTPSGGGDHFKVFSPYHKVWTRAPRRPVAAAPKALSLPPGLDTGPELDRLVPASRREGASPDRPEGGERAGRKRLGAWRSSGGLAGYEGDHDAMADDRTSRLSPYFHFGCLSPLEVATRLEGEDGAAAFVRQLCWRDFYHQVTAAFPAIASEDYRSRGDRWLDDDEVAAAWMEGRTGYPIVDAGMRQLRAEGWMHNRARMITASFLAKDLGVDWRVGAGHFLHWLADGDIAQNSANWQWTAGTGNDTRPNRMFNPLRQAERFDADGEYVRRWVPELAEVDRGRVHTPWKLDAADRPGDYPPPLVDHDEAAAAFRARRDGQEQFAI